MNLTHVLAFHRVAAAGSFTLAARMSGLSQPTLSAQVRALELATGSPLFARSGRRIHLTAAGEALFAATSRLSLAMEEVERALTPAPQRLRGRLRVSADSAVHVIPILAELKRRHAAFTFVIRIDNSGGVLSQVLGEEADVGVMARSVSDPRLHAIRIREDRLALIAGRGDALVCRRRVRLSDLDGRDLVVRERGSITREVLEGRLASAGVRPGEVFEVETREAVREAVAAGFGVGVVFASEAGDDRRLAALGIDDPGLAVAEYAICRAERKGLPLIARFLETARRLALDSGWLEVRS